METPAPFSMRYLSITLPLRIAFDENFKSNLAVLVSIVRVYYPVDIYFAGLFGFDGLELSFFWKILMQAGERRKGRKKQQG